MNNLFTGDIQDDIIRESYDLGAGDEVRPPKFYNFNYIILYSYMDTKAAHAATQDSILNTPIDLYESPYMAQLFVPSTSQKTLMAFAVDTRQLYDELDLELESKIRKLKKSEVDIKRNIPVIRSIQSYKQAGKKAKPYIKYTVQNKIAIKTIFPME